MIDLHLHLDGAISVKNARELAALQNIEIPESDDELKKLLTVSDGCKDLNEFLEKFEFPCKLLMTKEGISLAVKNLISELAESGVIYAEIRFAPQKSKSEKCSAEDAVIAATVGAKGGKIPVKFILCCMRGGSYEDNIETVKLAAKYKESGVVAIDLAGAEALFPLEDYKYIFELAKALGVPFTVHAGEALGADAVWKALELAPDRIGHGVRAYEDEKLLSELAKRKIPLELCPSSNICTAVFKDISEYPLEKFERAGIFCTVNTDDMSIEGTTLAAEYEKLGLTKEQILKYNLRSVEASFADEKLKDELKNKLVSLT